MNIRTGIGILIFVAIVAMAPVHAHSAERFLDNADGTVLDTHTNLTWLKDAGWLSAPVQVVNAVVQEMNAGMRENHGFSDWRIPTIEEMLSIVNTSEAYPSLSKGHPFIGIEPDKYWTSTGGFDLAGYAWVVDLSTGSYRFEFTSFCNFYRLWPVRSSGQTMVEKFDPEGLPVRPGDVAFLTIKSNLDKQGGKCEEAVGKTTAYPPTSVTAAAVSPTEILVSWRGGPKDVAWYNVYGVGDQAVSSATSSLKITNIDPDSKQCFSVTSYLASGIESAKSQEICAKTWSSKASSTVWASGLNSFGQLGNRSRVDSHILVQVSDLEDMTSVAAGVEHAAAVGKDGSIWLWGRNSRGQLGDGSTRNRVAPKRLEGIKEVRQAALGWYHTLALMQDGTVLAWGRNYYGQLGDGKGLDTPKPVSVRVLEDVAQVASGWYHSMALKGDGTVWTWGWDLKGQLGNGPNKDAFVPVKVIGLDGVKDISGGMYHSLALKSDGTVMAWGSNEFGQIGQPAETRDLHLSGIVKGLKPNVIAISGGMNFSIALMDDGTVWAWGRNDYGQLGRDDVNQSNEPLEVLGLKNIKTIAAGAHHAVAVDSGGALWYWGWDFAGKNKFAPPHKVGGLRGITGAAAGIHFSISLKGQ